MDTLELDDLTYERFRDLLLQRVGLAFPERKRADLQQGLSTLCRDNGLESLERLYQLAQGDGPIWDRIITQFTIGETYFFRNGAQFAMLRRHILPELMKRREATRNLRIWSAGCASGEEPYSLAMTLAELPEFQAGWQATILATDINHEFLARAQEGLYGAWSFRETSEEQRERFFAAEGPRWRLHPDIRRMVRFARLNLASGDYPAIATNTCALDIIVCRNVTIYFDEATTRRIVDQFYNALTPGGWLIVGHSEPQASVYSRFEVHNYPDTVVYRKPLQAPMFGFDAPSGTFRAGGEPVLRPGAWAGPAPTPPGRPATPALPSLPATQAAGYPLGAAPRSPAPSPAPAQPRPAPASPSSAAQLAEARRLANSGDLAGAEEQCQAVLNRDPLAIEAHFLLGQLAEQRGDPDAALAAYRRVVYLDRSFVLGTLGMASCWRRLDNLGEARRCYRNALKILEPLPANQPIAGADGATAGDLAKLCRAQLQEPAA